MDWMSLEGGGGIGVAAVVMTARSLLLRLVNLPSIEEANLEGHLSPKQRAGTIATWKIMMMTIVVEAVTHRTVRDHPEADRGVVPSIPTPPIQAVLSPGPDLDRGPWHLIPHHPPLPDLMIESIAVMVVVEDTAVEVGVVVEIEITIGGVTGIIVMGGAETIVEEGGNR